ncbi:MAG: hypothetical protein ABL883_10425 [Terricaulis sp.]
MASPTIPPAPDAAPDAVVEARQLAFALDAIEACLERLAPGASPMAIAEALAAPVRAFDAIAKETMAQ